MKIHVGTKNELKVKAAQNALKLYEAIFPNAEVLGIEVNVDLYGHPKTLEATIEGAIDRAKQAFINDCGLSIGLEGGLMVVPNTKSGYMEVGACAIYDGKQIYLGLSPAYEWPREIIRLIVEEGLDGSQAFKKSGISEHQKLGEVSGGGIGLLSKGKYTRERLTEASIIMALTHLENPEIY